MLMIYGTDLCPDCVAVKKELDAKGTEYKYMNITENLGSLKQFLKLRDTRDEFKAIRGSGKIGVPTFVTADKITLNREDVIKN